MKNRTQKKTSARKDKSAGLRAPNEVRPHGPSLGGGGPSIEALKHWLQVEAELMNARRGNWCVNTYTP